MLDDIVTKLILGDDAATNDQPDKDELEQQSSDAEIAAVAVITAAEGPFDGAEKIDNGNGQQHQSAHKGADLHHGSIGRSFSGLFGLWFLLRWSCGLWFFLRRGSMLIVSGHDGRRDIREEIIIPGKGTVLQVFHHA